MNPVNNDEHKEHKRIYKEHQRVHIALLEIDEQNIELTSPSNLTIGNTIVLSIPLHFIPDFSQIL